MNAVNSGNQAVKVVLVDDSTIVRERVAAILSALPGVEVTGQAATVSAGAALLEQLRPDVLILDIDLAEDESGTDLLEIINKRQDAPLIIMLSNYNQPQLRRKCFALGADFYFHKPTEFEKAFEVCRELSERRGKSMRTTGGPGTPANTKTANGGNKQTERSELE